MTAGIDMTGAASGDTLIAVNNGTDSRVYLYEDDANDDTAIEDAELTLLATLEATILAEGDFVVA